MSITRTRLSSIYVLDHEVALAFYVDVLGLEVSVDADVGAMRWLTVRAPDDDREILLELPGPPAHSEETTTQVRELLGRGAAGGWIGFATDDVDTLHTTLVERGVEVTQPPTDMSYGRDMAIRDPFGNHLRIGQIRPLEELRALQD